MITRMSLSKRLALSILLAATLAIPATAAADPVTRPAMPSPGVSAPGVDADCTPSKEHPVPVILLHGTRADKTINWAYLGPELVDLGYCVYSLDFPDRGQAPIAQSVAALAERVQQVREQTGAREVSLFGHSLGGTVARDYVKRGGGLKVVDDVITMGTTHHGYYSAPPYDEIDKAFNTECFSCWEQAQGSEYLLGLNEGDMTPGNVSYTSIITLDDGVALPYENQYLPEDRWVANVLLQDECEDHSVDHIGLALDPLVRDWVASALGRKGPADLNRTVNCSPEL